MRRFMVVANQTLRGDHLAAAVRERLAQGPCWFYIVIPRTPPQGMRCGRTRRPRRWRRSDSRVPWPDSVVSERTWTARSGIAIPIQAIGDALRALRGEHIDEIIVSTLRPGRRAGSRMDLPHRVEHLYRLPVTHVVGERNRQEQADEDAGGAIFGTVRAPAPLIGGTLDCGVSGSHGVTSRSRRG